MALKRAILFAFLGTLAPLSTKSFQVLYQYLHVLLILLSHFCCCIVMIFIIVFLVRHSGCFIGCRVYLLFIERSGMETAHLLFNIVMEEDSLPSQSSLTVREIDRLVRRPVLLLIIHLVLIVLLVHSEVMIHVCGGGIIFSP